MLAHPFHYYSYEGLDRERTSSFYQVSGTEKSHRNPDRVNRFDSKLLKLNGQVSDDQKISFAMVHDKQERII